MYPKKRHRRAMVLGSGPSVNLLTVATYERLRQHVDVWSINTAWVNRVVQPDFWHMEFHTMNVDVVEAPGGMLDFQKRFLDVESWGNRTRVVCTQGCFRADMIPGMATLPESHFIHYEGTKDPRDCAKGSSEYTCTEEHARYQPQGGGEQVKSLCCMSLMKVTPTLTQLQTRP